MPEKTTLLQKKNKKKTRYLSYLGKDAEVSLHNWKKHFMTIHQNKRLNCSKNVSHSRIRDNRWSTSFRPSPILIPLERASLDLTSNRKISSVTSDSRLLRNFRLWQTNQSLSRRYKIFSHISKVNIWLLSLSNHFLFCYY